MVSDEKGYSLRKAHFLKPFVTSIDDSVAELPHLSHTLSSSSSSDLKHLSSKVSFSGFWFAKREFLSWLAKMEALHEPIWRKAGIFEAIKASTYRISSDPSLVLALVEKWCPETKSFIFPWGEATITLEDVMLLLGFSVLGSAVFAPLESSEMRDCVEKLHKVRREVYARDHEVRQNVWISRFCGKDDEIEHEAFLVLWLSLFVFPGCKRRSISRNVIPIAVRLARGERLALAPVVLANIYRDLGQIRDKLHFMSLFKLVQVWTWERFKNIRPKASEIPKGAPRIAQWESLQQRFENVRPSFDDFDWRPYTKPLKNWNPLRFYVEEAMWLTIDDEFLSFARCVRSSHLVGNGFVEDYFPNRVAMQFGFAQDLPGLLPHQRNFTEKEAWDHYSKSLAGLKLYMPSRLDRGSVTARYRDWWLKSVSEFVSSKEAEKESTKGLPLSKVVQKLDEGDLTNMRRYTTCRLACEDYDDESMKDKEDDNMTIAKRIRSRKKYHSDAEETRGDDCKSRGQRKRKFQVVDSDDSDPFPKLYSPGE